MCNASLCKLCNLTPKLCGLKPYNSIDSGESQVAIESLRWLEMRLLIKYFWLFSKNIRRAPMNEQVKWTNLSLEAIKAKRSGDYGEKINAL
jgi:hypothetical protein